MGQAGAKPCERPFYKNNASYGKSMFYCLKTKRVHFNKIIFFIAHPSFIDYQELV